MNEEKLSELAMLKMAVTEAREETAVLKARIDAALESIERESALSRVTDSANVAVLAVMAATGLDPAEAARRVEAAAVLLASAVDADERQLTLPVEG